VARGVTPEDLASRNASFIKPGDFVDLVAEADKAVGF
jgi:hypothetical protein